jgi:signal transduction histidine kinase
VTDTGVPARADGARGGVSNGAASHAPDGARAALAGAHGYGLAGIAERVASCGGSLTVGPVSPFGFAVTARLPVR